jgi:phosphoribosyl 1,2-cyclic phosphodiesterase
MTAPMENNIKLCVLGSGSRGNSIFVKCRDTRLLLDAGFSGVQVTKRLALIEEAPERLDAIILSHEHTDHVLGAGVLSRKYRIPVYMNRMTHEAAGIALGRLFSTVFFQPGDDLHINDVLLEPFSLPHDAKDPVGLVLKWDGKKIAMVTDLGTPTHLVREKSAGSDILILEFNHDPVMLAEGPYPWALKQRIKSREGHLSNEESAELLRNVIHPGLRHVFVAHISGHNNRPQLALSHAEKALQGHKATLELTYQDRISDTVYL